MKEGKASPWGESLPPTLDGAIDQTLVAEADSGHHPTRQPLAPGMRVGRFVLGRKLGEGGMGVVYLAHDPTLERAVAVKIVRIVRGGSEGAEARQRMLREAQAMAMLNHPNLITIYEVGTLGRDVFLAMEYVVGQTLDRWLEVPHTIEEVLDVFEQAGRALQAIHDAGLVHRDFKPSNVLVTEAGSAKLLDLGIASKAVAERSLRLRLDPGASNSIDSEEVSTVGPLGYAQGKTPPAWGDALSGRGGSAFDGPLTQEGALVGTPSYMSPEQVLGQPVVPASDQFTYGVALFEALTGMRPFGGGDAGQVLANITLNERNDWPSDCRVPQPLRRVVERTLAETPGERFPSMNAVLEACQQALGPSGPLRASTARWLSRDRSQDELLPEGKLLIEGLQVLREHPEALSGDARELLRASWFAVKKRRLRRRALMGGLGALAVGLLPTGYLLNQRSKQLQRAVRAELNAHLDGVSRDVETIFARADENVRLLYAQRAAWLPLVDALIVPGDPGYPELEQRLRGPFERFNDFFRPIVEQSSTISSIQLARDDGVELLLLDDPSAQRLVPPYRLENRLVRRETFGESAFVLYWPDRRREAPRAGWLFAGMLDGRGRVWAGYDPRKRNWYRRSATRPAGEVSWTDPYLFFETKEPGMTASTSWHDGRHRYVLAVDFAVTDISRVTARLEHPRFFALVATALGGIVGLPHSASFRSDANVREFFVNYDDARRRAKLQGKPTDAAAELPTARDIGLPLVARALDARPGPGVSTWSFDVGGETRWAGYRPVGGSEQKLGIYVVEKNAGP